MRRTSSGRFGDHLDKDARYARADEFLGVVRRLFAGETVSLNGEYVNVEEAALAVPPNPDTAAGLRGLLQGRRPGRSTPFRCLPHPRVSRPASVAEKIAWIRKEAEAEGRTLRFGIRLHTISRDTADEAWAQADKLIGALDEQTVQAAQAGLARSQSEGQKRMLALHEANRTNGTWSDARSLEIAPNLWSGVGLVRGGRAPPWSAATPRSPTGSPSTPTSASTSSSSPATHIWRSCTGSARAWCRSCGNAVCSTQAPPIAPSVSIPFVGSAR